MAPRTRRASAGSFVRRIGGRLRTSVQRYEAVARRRSSTATTPWSSAVRMRRPAPWASRVAASGRSTEAKAFRLAFVAASRLASASGSSGRAKGSRSMTTSEQVAPGASKPCQNPMVATSTEVSSSRNRRCRSGLGSWSWTRTSTSRCSRRCAAATAMARLLVNSPSVRPPAGATSSVSSVSIAGS